MPGKTFIMVFLLAFFAAAPLFAEVEKEPEGTIFTLWPFVDYRESPMEGYSNLSVLGPLFKLQRRGDDRDIAVRPFFYEKSNRRNGTDERDYLYPIAASSDSPDATKVQVLDLYQKDIYRKDEEEKTEQGTMLFPFYIKGSSSKYGPYLSLFPFYGDLYERFWRDEYHYVMFPLYGKTVKKGKTTRNYLYPVFSLISGEKESGFQVWPLYGEAEKEGVYSKRFVLWPFFLKEASGLDTDNPTRRFYLLPLYAAIDSPKSTSRYYLWPFFGHRSDADGHQEETDYFWPFWRTIRGEKRTLDSWLPFYSLDVRAETRKRWIMWPLFKHEEINSDVFCQENNRILYFLYTDDRQSWPKAEGDKVRTALWPFFVYNKSPRGIKSLGIPAPVEPILNKEGIEKSWAPLWRIYQQKWNDRGDSTVSFLWNLYWHERRGTDLAFELFPIIAYRYERKLTDIKIVKGLVRFRDDGGDKALSFFWLPFGIHWGNVTVTGNGPATGSGR
jgi:hypothetical protein